MSEDTKVGVVHDRGRLKLIAIIVGALAVVGTVSLSIYYIRTAYDSLEKAEQAEKTERPEQVIIDENTFLEEDQEEIKGSETELPRPEVKPVFGGETE